MPKINFATMPRTKVEPRRTLVKTAFGEAELWLRPLDGPMREAASEKADLLTRQYVTGGFVHPSSGDWCPVDSPMPFADIEGETVEVSERLFTILTRLEAMQKPPNPEDAYTWEDLLHLAVRDDSAWQDIQIACAKVADSGKASKES